MNKLTTSERAQLLTSLVEGNSIASTCRMFGVNKITVLRLLADAGTFAADFHDAKVHSLPTERVQMDEIWSFIHSKHKNVKVENVSRHHGDVWTWVSIDADSKLAINWLVGNRNGAHANEFVADLANRLANRVQLTGDGLDAYRTAVEKAFGEEVDYAALIKEYAMDKSVGRYSPPICVAARPEPVTGNPDPKHINTSFIERHNLTMRMQMRRFTRLTNAFSKKIENHRYAIALYFVHYNFIRKHQTIKTTPAVMAGITDRVWTMFDFVQMMELQEATKGGRLTDYKPAASKKNGGGAWPAY